MAQSFSNANIVIVPGCTVYLHPHRDPHNVSGYQATRNIPFVCHPAKHQTQLQPQHQPQPQFQQTQVNVRPECERKLEEVTTQYTSVADKVNRTVLSLHDALKEAKLNRSMFKRRRIIAETNIALPTIVKTSLHKYRCGKDLTLMFQKCKGIYIISDGDWSTKD